ncbi:hypothetical protein GCM10029976_007700 [Kribbella albertanoniae]
MLAIRHPPTLIPTRTPGSLDASQRAAIREWEDCAASNRSTTTQQSQSTTHPTHSTGPSRLPKAVINVRRNGDPPSDLSDVSEGSWLTSEGAETGPPMFRTLVKGRG